MIASLYKDSLRLPRRRMKSFVSLIFLPLVLHASSLEPSKPPFQSLSTVSYMQLRGGALNKKTSDIGFNLWKREPLNQRETTRSSTTHHQAAALKSTLTAQTATSSRVPSFHLSSNIQTKIKYTAFAAASIALLYMIKINFGHYLSPTYLQAKTIQILRNLQPSDPNDQWKALVVYSLGMACWELLGLSTIPVETAAAMVLGWNALLASALGKLLGALAAYGLGRSVLREWATQKLSNNAFFQQLQDSHHHGGAVVATKRPLTLRLHSPPPPTLPDDGLDFLRTPLATAFLMKFSCFPEFFKNFGSALLAPVTLQRFVLVTVLHGWSYTALWTLLGVDSAKRIEASQFMLPAPARNYVLSSCLGLSFVVGFVVSPALMAWWIRDLKTRSALQAGTARVTRTNSARGRY
ncbi:hypothetical protein MPSEU_000866900 [Mayamaea pseudoterrestris]|nr:hypothetical protein MPSEU_000866900 [Mayamaea pseudoterrestris]